MGKSNVELDRLAPLLDIQKLLAAHPDFYVVPVEQSIRPNPMAALIGSGIKALRLLKFGAEFNRKLTLLSFDMHHIDQSKIILRLCWHASGVLSDWTAFIHFLDEEGAIRFQGDYSLDAQAPNAFGILYSQRNIEVPAEVPAGTYRVRIGIWSPRADVHMPLTRFRGCLRESTHWCRNAVILESFKM